MKQFDWLFRLAPGAWRPSLLISSSSISLKYQVQVLNFLLIGHNEKKKEENTRLCGAVVVGFGLIAS